MDLALRIKEKRTIELQNIDCNCNDCSHLVRSLSKRQTHVDLHYNLQKKAFDRKRVRLIEKAEYWIKKEEKEKAKLILKDVRKMNFVFNEGECSLSFGRCQSKNKEVSFIANTCQLDTQECFKNRSFI